ncbi:uncharacterized protein CC84DRAFT_1226700 [Paraphaeosphaeria sporulosa]|uniref:Uncharacterized protein n=1 Tax=Paraphaeosphaeria sporulosa TaxID=1460663 RepID=A0A177CXY6_9PLEO|nr:uncharacterized protein CC84DRAFT_1226700 [Paraphaeosphaeria sporulosa]OAG12434.1 hypothetical protein CC84DRAFT_1226700 [Paraphaeosphaeria sporulosa]
MLRDHLGHFTPLSPRIGTRAQAVLSPKIICHRNPPAEHNLECFSEDPLISGNLAAAIVR